jgi:dGTPase
MITAMVSDVVQESRRRLHTIAPPTPDDIRSAGSAAVAFSAALEADLKSLKAFLFANVYRHPKVMSVMEAAETIVRDLFGRYLETPSAMPETWGAQAAGLDDRRRARLVSDFVSGQTDRYAVAEHEKWFVTTPQLR